MMKAEVGSSPYVTGSRSATVRAGPMPGSTPIAVPTVTPRSDQSRFSGVSATAKPWLRAVSVSMVAYSGCLVYCLERPLSALRRGALIGRCHQLEQLAARQREVEPVIEDDEG